VLLLKKEIQARKQDFNNDWKFSLGKFSSMSTVNFDGSSWRKSDLLHDWSIEGKSEKTIQAEMMADFFHWERLGAEKHFWFLLNGKTK
jgi:hypothetical protein